MVKYKDPTYETVKLDEVIEDVVVADEAAVLIGRVRADKDVILHTPEKALAQLHAAAQAKILGDDVVAQ